MAKTPATRDWSQLRTDILNAVGLPGSTNAQARALAAQKRAVDRLNNRTWRMLATAGTDITLVADTGTYDLDASFIGIRRLSLLDSNGKVKGRLGYRAWEQFEDMWPDRSQSGDPREYTVYNTAANFQVELSCPPSSAFVANFPSLRPRIFAAVIPLVGASDNFGSDQGVRSEMEFFVELYSRYLICLDFFPAQADRWKREAEEAYTRLEIMDNEFDFKDWE